MNDEIQRRALDSLKDKKVIKLRYDLVEVVGAAFAETSIQLQENNYLIKKEIELNSIDRALLAEEENAICLIMRIAGDLVKSANILFKSNNNYSASALIRQLVEIEYLAWAFDNDHNEARKWINSTKEERFKFFSPAKLRKAAQGRFRSKDYSYHCELGGHPVPQISNVLLDNKNNIAQLMLSDMISHTWRIWDHLVNWSMSYYSIHPIMKKSLFLIDKFDYWEKNDYSTKLPPPE